MFISTVHNPSSRVFLEKLTGFQEFPAFYGIRRFITAFTSVRHLSLSWASSIQPIPPTSHFLKIHLNIILLPMPRSSKWSNFKRHRANIFLLRLPDDISLCTPVLCRVQSSSLNSQMNPVHISPSCFFKIYFNFALPPARRSYEWLLSFRVPDRHFLCISLLSHIRPRSSNPSGDWFTQGGCFLCAKTVLRKKSRMWQH